MSFVSKCLSLINMVNVDGSVWHKHFMWLNIVVLLNLLKCSKFMKFQQDKYKCPVGFKEKSQLDFDGQRSKVRKYIIRSMILDKFGGVEAKLSHIQWVHSMFSSNFLAKKQKMYFLQKKLGPPSHHHHHITLRCKPSIKLLSLSLSSDEILSVILIHGLCLFCIQVTLNTHTTDWDYCNELCDHSHYTHCTG